MATKSISQLDTAATLDNGDLFETAIPDVGSASGYASKKMTLAQLADYTANDVVYPDFKTSAQSITGAVNQTLLNLADEYDATATYTEGAVVLYAGNLYKCETAVETPEAFDPTKWTQGTAADFFAGGGDTSGIVTAGSSFEDYNKSTQDNDITIELLLKTGDIVVFVVNHRSALTLPTGVELIHTNPGIGSSNQALTFAKYTAAADEVKVFTFTVAAAGRKQLEYAVFRNVTITYTGDFYAAETAAVTSITAPTKQPGEILLWGFNASTKNSGNTDGIQTTPADIYKIAWPNAAGSDIVARGGAFYDDGTGAINRTFSNVYGGTSTMQIDAVKIIQN